MQKKKITPGSYKARQHLRNYVEEEEKESSVTDWDRMASAGFISGSGRAGVLEKGKIIYLDGTFMTAEENIPLGNPSLLRQRLKAVSVMDTIMDITSDIKLD